MIRTAPAVSFYCTGGFRLLDGDYAAFGKVTAGMDIVDKICQSVQPIDNNGTVPADQQPKITAIKVID